MKSAYIAELIGSFFIMLVFLMTANNADAGWIFPLATGMIMVTAVYVGRTWSEAHFNPAVSMAAMIGGRLERRDFPYYVLAQLLGAMLAAAIGIFLLNSNRTAVDIDPHRHDPLATILAELIGTFAVVLANQRVSIAHVPATGSLTWTAMSFTFRNISGAAFNPALVVGMLVSGMALTSDAWLYGIGQLLGAAAAASVMQFFKTVDG
jgi:aquaporin Z